jgi:hypothetical protein
VSLENVPMMAEVELSSSLASSPTFSAFFCLLSAISIPQFILAAGAKPAFFWGHFGTHSTSRLSALRSGQAFKVVP